MGKHGIAWHEKTLGQLFCDDSAQQIVDMLVDECEKGNVTMRLRSEVLSVEREGDDFILELNGMTVGTKKLVIASGGLSMPGLGATPFGYKIAEQFGLNVLPTRAGLVPFTLHKPLLEQLQVLSGVSVSSVITPRTAPSFVKICSLHTAGFLVRPYCRFPVFGSQANLSALICCRMLTLRASSMTNAAPTLIRA